MAKKRSSKISLKLTLPTLAILIAGMGHAQASSAPPIEVKSDPFGTGKPTHYSILKGTTRLTFSQPIGGRFLRAEIAIREKSGTKITRFQLSSDGKSYRPTLQLENPFEKHFSTGDDENCEAPSAPSSLDLVSLLKPKVDDSVLIAKKRDELVKAGFFDSSCFDSSIKPEHRDAIMNAAADVLAIETQDEAPEPKYLRCLEKNGFAHEAGIVQALIKQATNKPHPQPRMRIACTTDRKAKPAVYDEATGLITVKTTFKPVREDYAKNIFHEVLHPIPMRDGTMLNTAEECCSKGLNCDVLQAYAKQVNQGERATAVIESIYQRCTIPNSILAANSGPFEESRTLGSSEKTISAIEDLSIKPQSSTPVCEAMGQGQCRQTVDAAIADLLQVSRKKIITPSRGSSYKIKLERNLVDSFIDRAFAATVSTSTCAGDERQPFLQPAIEEAVRNSENGMTPVELARAIPQVSPIDWDAAPSGGASEAPGNPGPSINLAGNSGGSGYGREAYDTGATRVRASTPTRTIASVSPLPEAKSNHQLGRGSNRSDVRSGRATAIIDPIEKVARKISATLTEPVLQLKKVEPDQIFAKDFKPKTKSPQYMVVSSTKNPILVADVGDMADLSFANPFKDAKADAKDKKMDAKPLGGLVNSTSKPVGQAPPKSLANPTSTTNSPSVARSTASTNKPEKQPGQHSDNAKDFRAMERMDLVRFITSGFRNVSPELENPIFAEALVKNHIQILDHENRRIGSMSPEMTFVYRADLGRLVQTRVERAKK